MKSSARKLADGRGLVLAVHDARAPSDEEWAEYLEHCRALMAACADETKVSGLAITDGGAPSAKQRRQVVGVVHEAYGDRVDRIRSSVLSDNLLVRSVVTALSWHIPEVRIFPSSAIEGALEHVRVEPAEWAVIARDLEVLCDALPHARTARSVVVRLRVRRPE